MILVKKAIAYPDDFNLAGSIIQNPYKVFMPYWKGDVGSFFEYMKANGLEYNFKADNLVELNRKGSEFLARLSDAIKKNIGQFDPRIINTLGQRNLVDFAANDYLKITFKREDNLPFSEDEVNTFLNNPSRSFIDLREVNQAGNELTLVYNRRGLYDEGSRIAALKSKDTLTFKENFKEAKDNNFILSGFAYEFANLGQDFKHSYVVGDDERVNIITAEEILNAKYEREDRNEAAMAQKVAQDVASDELRKERQERRQSLAYDTTTGEILAEASTEIRLNPVADNIKTINENINNSINNNDDNNVDNSNSVNNTKDALAQMVEQSIDFYEQKEIEKMKIRLNKARADAKVAYEDMLYKIRNGASALEALNFIKQKYSEEHTINMASAFLAKDIIEVDIKNNEISALRGKISELDKTITMQNDEITKREQTITSLKSTLQQKVNEISLLGEKHEEDLKAVAQAAKEEAEKQLTQLESELTQIKNSYGEIIAKKDEELAQQDEAIYKFSAINENSNLRIKELEEKVEKLTKENGILEYNNAELLKKVEDFSNINKNYTNVKKDEVNVKKYDEKVKKDDENVKKYDTIADKKNMSQEDLLKMLEDEKITGRQKLEIIQQIDVMKAINANGQILENKEESENGTRSFKRQQH